MKKNMGFALLVCLFGLISLSWFNPGSMLTSLFADYYMHIEGVEIFKESFYSWSINSFGGFSHAAGAFLFPQGLFLFLASKLGLSNVVTEMVWFYVSFCGMGLSMYYLVTRVVEGENKYLAGFIAALLFMFNPWTAITHTFVWPYMVFLPLILGLYINGLNQKKGFKYIIVMCIVWMLTCSSGLTSIRAILHHWMALLTFLAYYLFVNRKNGNVSFGLKFTAKLFGFWVVLNSFYLLPMIVNMFSIVKNSADIYSAINFTWRDAYNMSSIRIMEGLRLSGYWAMKESYAYKGSHYLTWASNFGNVLYIFIGYLIPLIAVSSFVLYRKKIKANSNIIFFAITAVLSLIAINGAHNIFNRIVIKLLPHYATVFSNPYFYGGLFLTISYSVLFGYSFSVVFERSKALGRTILILLSCLVIFVYAKPLWTGEVFRTGDEMLGSERYQVPAYWEEAKEWSKNEKEEFRIFELPYSKLGYMSYTWPKNGYNGPDPAADLMDGRIIYGINPALKLAEGFKGMPEDKICVELGKMNVRYLMILNDANMKFIEEHPFYAKIDAKMLSELPGKFKLLKLEKRIGKLDFYKVPDKYFLPRVHSADDKTVKVSFKKISPVEWLVDIETQKPFNLVFSENFNQGWKAAVAAEQLPETTHYQANDFANAWKIEKAGRYQVKLYFAPQKLFHFGLVISSLVFLFAVLFLVFWRSKTDS